MNEEAIRFAMAIAEGYEGLAGLKKGLYYPYQGKADRKDVWTIGRGHVVTDKEATNGIKIGDARYLPNDGLTLELVDMLFVEDVTARIAPCRKAIGNSTPRQAGAFLDCFFNCPAALRPDSSALKGHKAGKALDAAAGFLKYTVVVLERFPKGHPKAGRAKKWVHRRGLFRRRGTDALLYLTGEVHIAKTDATEAALEKRLKDLGVRYTKPPFDKIMMAR